MVNFLAFLTKQPVYLSIPKAYVIVNIDILTEWLHLKFE